MKNQDYFMKVFALVFLALFTFCSAQQKRISSPNPKPIPLIEEEEDKIPDPPVEEKKTQSPLTKEKVGKKLEYYLYGREIKPSVIVNNTERDQTEIDLENNKIKWIRDKKETRVDINGDIFTLKDKSSINNADDSEKISGNIVDNWREIKFYKINNRKLIAINMGSEFCTGLMCSVSFYLIYDLKTRSKNFFGDFRTGIEMKLYDFGNDGTIDFLSTTNDFTYTPGIEIKHIYNLYTLEEEGIFQVKKDKKQKPFFIKRVFSSDNYEELIDKFEQHWIEEIK
jgi:hypothetical protein